MATLIKTYIKRPVRYTACGYACSDHASWTLNGYKAVLPAEAAMEKTNPYIHSPQDKPELLSLEHMTDYAKLAIATAVELAEPIK
jgi:leucyl aminopeptidase